jgi:acetyl-CoA C-acetyltransferase
MSDIVICNPKRTPVGRYGGALRSLSAQSLAARVIEAVMQETDLDPVGVDDVILGHCYPTGENPAIGRVAALDAGLPITVPGSQVDRRCGSGLWAVLVAAAQIQAGVSSLVLAGGAESMSQAEYYAVGLRFDRPTGDIVLHDRLGRGRVTAGGCRYPVPGGMLETAENLRRDYDISREEQDELAFRSHQRAIAAQDGGIFAAELVPVAVSGRGGDTIIDSDEHPRRDATREKLSGLRAVRSAQDESATVTAGNASGQNDGAAVCIVTTAEKADALGLTALVRLVSWAVAGVAPDRMGIGPVPATEQALDRAGLSLGDIDLIELNEAFAAQVLAVTREWKFGEADFERLNVNGSGISLGHPVGATGARILTTLAHELQRREDRYGLETMCIGGGQGLAAVFERVS